MESYIKLTVVQSDSKKILISFLYSTACAINILIDDTISLFVEGTTEALAYVNVGNPSGHWSQGGNFKVGQVTLDISAVTFHNKRYNLCYVSQGTVRSSLALTWRPADGALLEEKNEQKPATSAMQDYTYISGISSDTSSFECSRMLSHPSSSFVVVNESDSKPQEPDIENDFQSQPDDFEGFPDPVKSRSNSGNIESEPWIQSPGTPSEELSKVEDVVANTPSEVLSKVEDVVANAEVLSTVSKTAQKSNSPDANLTRSDIPPDMSASVNWDDRVVSQKEVQLLRSNNRDLHQKIKTLTKIMENMQNKLQEKPGDAETTEKIRLLESEIKQCKQEIDALQFGIAKLKEEKHILKKKNAQLTVEKNTQFERSATLLNELQDKEKENEVLRSENMVLQGKLKRLEGNERKKKRQPRHEEHDQRRSDKVDPIENPVKLTPRKTLIESGHKTEPPTSRPSDLPLTGGAKLKPTPPPQIIPHERRQAAPEGRKTNQPPMDKQPTRQPFMRSSQQKPEAQKRGDPVRNSKPLHSDQRASDMTISERRVGEIANSLRGTSSIICPVCQKSLHAREDEYSVLLHVEQCLQRT